uniref:uncharacterized protein LOC120329814 n=1 Tax=Styela clava TaxID=7725 RepID=UPI0019397320|nr:uncharacterized protein LOC120329814 [Styela clava]
MMFILLAIVSAFAMTTCASTCILPEITCETAWEQMPNKLYQVFGGNDPFNEVTSCRTLTNIRPICNTQQMKINFTSYSETFGHASFDGVFQKKDTGTYKIIISEEAREDLILHDKFIADVKKTGNAEDSNEEFNSFVDMDHVFYSCDGKVLIHVWCSDNGRVVQVFKGSAKSTAEDALYVHNTFAKWKNGWENVELYPSTCSLQPASKF